MSMDNKSLLIIGLVVGGLACIYCNYIDLASAIFGGLVGYLSHGVNSSVNSVNDNVNSVDEE